MRRLIILFILYIALSAGQVVRLPSSYKNGIKWEFGTNIFRGDVLARSNVGQVPIASAVYKKRPHVPMARKEPVVTTVYKKASIIPDVYEKKPIAPIVYKKQSVMQNVREQQSTMPVVLQAQSVMSNIYNGGSIAQNIYKQPTEVSTIRNKPVVSNIYRIQPIRPSVYHQGQSSHHFVIPKVPSVDSQKRTEQRIWNYHYNTYQPFTVRAASHN